MPTTPHTFAPDGRLTRGAAPGPGVECHRRRVLGLGAASLLGVTGLAGLLTGCATVLGPRTIDIPQARLMEAIGARFPFGIKVLDTFELVAVSPRLKLQPAENRIVTELDVNALEGLGTRPLKATVGLSYGLRFEPSDASVRLTQVRVDKLDAGQWGILLRGQSNRVATAIAERLLDDLPVYTLERDDAERLRSRGYVPGEIRVTQTGLSVTLQPKP